MQGLIQTRQYPRKSGYTGGGKSPAAIAATIAVHVTVAGAIMLMPSQIIIKQFGEPFWTENVPAESPPPETPPEATPQKDEMKVTASETMVDSGIKSGPDLLFDDHITPVIPQPPIPLDPQPPQPIFKQARPDPRYAEDFQPQYPGAMIRSEIEGFVKLRVFISADGRVTSAELIEATDPSFWETTRRQALRYWRFAPATRDGKAIASEQVMTVRFRLADL